MLLYLTKRTVLQDEMSGKEEGTCFCLRLLSRKYAFQSFDQNISGIVTDRVKFYL